MNKRDLLKKVYNSKNNIIVNGRINSRKTYGVMFPLMDIIIENGESFFVLDSKEEFFKNYYNELKVKGYETIIVNLRNSLASDGWNPLTYAYSLYCSDHIDEATRSIEKIADVLFSDEDSDRFWAVSAKNLFLGIVWFLFERAKEEEINFNSIVELLDLFADKEDMFRGNTRSCRLLTSITKAPQETRRSVISIVRQELNKYTNYPNLSKLLATPMKRIDLNKKFAILLINRDEDLYFNSLSAIFIDQFYDYLQKSNYNLPFNFILDNYETIIDDYKNLDILLYSGPSRKVRTIIGTSENLDYLDNVCERVESTEESIKVTINKEDNEANNDYERIDLNQVVKYPQLECSEIQIYNYENNSPYDYSFLKEPLKESQGIIDFNEFINTHNFDDIFIETKNEYESKKTFDIESIIKSIDEEIERLEQEKVSGDKNDFEKFLEDNTYEETGELIEDEEDSFEQLLEAIDKEIELLDNKVNNDNKKEYDDIIRRIDEEIERLEREESVKEEAETTRNEFLDFLNSHNFDDIYEMGENKLSDNLTDSMEKLSRELDEEIARLTKEDNEAKVIEIN
jgi:hypothetical protein